MQGIVSLSTARYRFIPLTLAPSRSPKKEGNRVTSDLRPCPSCRAISAPIFGFFGFSDDPSLGRARIRSIASARRASSSRPSFSTRSWRARAPERRRSATKQKRTAVPPPPPRRPPPPSVRVRRGGGSGPPPPPRHRSGRRRFHRRNNSNSNRSRRRGACRSPSSARSCFGAGRKWWSS